MGHQWDTHPFSTPRYCMLHGFLAKKGERPQFRYAGSTLPWPFRLQAIHSPLPRLKAMHRLQRNGD